MEKSPLNLLGAYGPWAERTAARPGRLSFAEAVRGGRMPLAAWKKQGRAAVREALGPLPAGAEGQPEGTVDQAQIVKRYAFDGLAVEELSWQLPYGPPTQAVFLKPENAREPLPGVLALHDHGAVKHFGWRKIARTGPDLHPFLKQHQETYYGGVGWANELARRGYGVLVHDVFPFGSRRILPSDLPAYAVERLLAAPQELKELTPEDVLPRAARTDVDVPPEEPLESLARYEAFAGRHEEVLARSLLCLGVTFPGIVLGEDLAALGVLAGRPDVDPDRLGCCGLSGGGLRTAYLAGMDDSIDCAVSVGFMTTWRDFALNTSYTHTWMIYPPLLPRQLDFPEILALRVPLPTLVLASRQDPLFTVTEIERAGELIEGIYRYAGAGEAAHTSLYPGPHCFNREMQAEAFAWLDRWLKAEQV
jgi:dienelactone hydrolase